MAWLSCLLKSTTAQVLTISTPYLVMCMPTSELVVNGETLSPSEDRGPLPETAPHGSSPLHLPPRLAGGNHVVAALKDIVTCTF